MHVISIKRLRDVWASYPDAEEALKFWFHEEKAAEWATSAELKAKYRTASIINAERVGSISAAIGTVWSYRSTTRVVRCLSGSLVPIVNTTGLMWRRSDESKIDYSDSQKFCLGFSVVFVAEPSEASSGLNTHVFSYSMDQDKTFGNRSKTEAEHEAALERIEEIFNAIPGTPAAGECEFLVHLVEAYEAEKHPIDLPSRATDLSLDAQ